GRAAAEAIDEPWRIGHVVDAAAGREDADGLARAAQEMKQVLDGLAVAAAAHARVHEHPRGALREDVRHLLLPASVSHEPVELDARVARRGLDRHGVLAGAHRERADRVEEALAARERRRCRLALAGDG